MAIANVPGAQLALVKRMLARATDDVDALRTQLDQRDRRVAELESECVVWKARFQLQSNSMSGNTASEWTIPGAGNGTAPVAAPDVANTANRVHEHELEQARAAHDRLRAENEGLKQRIESLESEVKLTRQRAESAEAEHRALQVKGMQVAAAERAAADIKAHEEQYAEDRFTQLRQQMAEKEGRLMEAQGRAAMLAEELEAARLRARDLDREVTALKSAPTSFRTSEDSELRFLTVEAEKVRDQLSKLHVELRRSQAEELRIKTVLADRDTVLRSVENERDDSRRKFVELEKQKDEMQREMRTRIDELQSKLSNDDANSRDAGAERLERTREFTRRMDTLERLRKLDLHELQKQVEGLVIARDQAQSDSDALRRRASDLERDHGILATELAALRDEHKRVLTDRDPLHNADAEAVVRTVDMWERQHEALQRENGLLSERLQLLDLDLRSRSHQLAGMEENRNRVERENESLRQQLRAHQEELARWMRREWSRDATSAGTGGSSSAGGGISTPSRTLFSSSSLSLSSPFASSSTPNHTNNLSQDVGNSISTTMSTAGSGVMAGLVSPDAIAAPWTSNDVQVLQDRLRRRDMEFTELQAQLSGERDALTQARVSVWRLQQECEQAQQRATVESERARVQALAFSALDSEVTELRAQNSEVEDLRSRQDTLMVQLAVLTRENRVLKAQLARVLGARTDDERRQAVEVARVQALVQVVEDRAAGGNGGSSGPDGVSSILTSSLMAGGVGGTSLSTASVAVDTRDLRRSGSDDVSDQFDEDSGDDWSDEIGENGRHAENELGTSRDRIRIRGAERSNVQRRSHDHPRRMDDSFASHSELNQNEIDGNSSGEFGHSGSEPHNLSHQKNRRHRFHRRGDEALAHPDHETRGRGHRRRNAHRQSFGRTNHRDSHRSDELDEDPGDGWVSDPNRDPDVDDHHNSRQPSPNTPTFIHCEKSYIHTVVGGARRVRNVSIQEPAPKRSSSEDHRMDGVVDGEFGVDRGGDSVSANEETVRDEFLKFQLHAEARIQELESELLTVHEALDQALAERDRMERELAINCELVDFLKSPSSTTVGDTDGGTVVGDSAAVLPGVDEITGAHGSPMDGLNVSSTSQINCIPSSAGFDPEERSNDGSEPILSERNMEDVMVAPSSSPSSSSTNCAAAPSAGPSSMQMRAIETLRSALADAEHRIQELEEDRRQLQEASLLQCQEFAAEKEKMGIELSRLQRRAAETDVNAVRPFTGEGIVFGRERGASTGSGIGGPIDSDVVKTLQRMLSEERRRSEDVEALYKTLQERMQSLSDDLVHYKALEPTAQQVPKLNARIGELESQCSRLESKIITEMKATRSVTQSFKAAEESLTEERRQREHLEHSLKMAKAYTSSFIDRLIDSMSIT